MPSKPPTRRQEKVQRIIKEAVSDIILNHLNDPRIEGLITVTEVEVSPDIRNADIFISVMAADEKAAKKTFDAVNHATKHIQSLLAERMTTRFTPLLRFLKDEKLKKTLETLRLIEEAAKEYRHTETGQDNNDHGDTRPEDVSE